MRTDLRIVLASSSPYRKQLLSKILTNFDTASPDIDETAMQGESPQDLAARLASQKAQALAKDYPNSLIIGSDQIAWLDGNQLQKPGTRERNIAQLQQASGKTVQFFTSIHLLNTRTGQSQSAVETYTTEFRQLNESQITHYVSREDALNCAGGFKMEGLGISLFKRIEGQDPNILIGLPLIRLINMLYQEGIDVLSCH